MALICIAAFLASTLTFFSGFGLGTLLTPVFALFFPIQTAIAATAIVHLASNLFKVGLVGRDADWTVVARFGLPAAAGRLRTGCADTPRHPAEAAGRAGKAGRFGRRFVARTDEGTED